MSNAGRLNITIDQGATFTLPFQVLGDDGNPVSLSLATIRGKVKTTPQASTVVATFTGTVTDGPEGEGQVVLTAAETAAIPADNSEKGNRVLTTYMYDIEVVYSDATVQRILEGYAFLSPEVTTT